MASIKKVVKKTIILEVETGLSNAVLKKKEDWHWAFRDRFDLAGVVTQVFVKADQPPGKKPTRAPR